MNDLLRGPVRSRAVLMGILAEAAIIAAAFGVAPEHVETATVTLGSLVNITVILGIVSGTAGTTPSSDPRDDRGVRLVPEVGGGPDPFGPVPGDEDPHDDPDVA